MKRLELTGQRFGRLVVKQFAGMTRGNRSTWLCLCDCGGTVIARSNHLTEGDTRSCGCLVRELATRNHTQIKTHGETCGPAGNQLPTSEYMTWTAMKQRCFNPNSNGYKNYGGRGITVWERWRESFPAFLADVGRRPSSEHSLDRYPNNDGNYEPGNVRWATRHEQNINKRPSVPKGTKRKQPHERSEDKRPGT